MNLLCQIAGIAVVIAAAWLVWSRPSAMSWGFFLYVNWFNPGQEYAFYAILQSMGVPSRLLIFPNENHWVLTPQNAIYWHWEMQSWLARYLGGKPVLEKPVFESEAK